MTEPSQYFKGRTVQEQMDEVIGYVDKRAEEVAAAKADDVLQPAEDAKTAAQTAAEAAEAAKNATIAALPEIRQDITGLKAEDAALDGRLNTVELKVTTAEGNIVTIQGQIVALQNVQGDYLKKDGATQTVTSQIMVPTTAVGARDTQIANGTRIQDDLDNYAAMIRTTGNQMKSGTLTLIDGISAYDNDWHPTYADKGSMGDLKLFAKLRNSAPGKYFMMEFIQSSNTALCYGIAGVRNAAELASGALGWFIRKDFGNNNPLQIDAIALVSDGTDWYLASRKKVTYGTLMVRIKVANNYTTIDKYPTPQIEWLNQEINIGDGAGYTVIEAVE